MVTRRRGFGEIERRTSTAGRASYRARYALPDGTRYSRTFGTKVDAEAWLANENALLSKDDWTSPEARKADQARREADAARNTLATFSDWYLAERPLRPNTRRQYRLLLDAVILPVLGTMPMQSITLTDIKAWRSALDPHKEATNAAAYRLLRSLLQAAEEEELVFRVPPKIRGAATARVRRVARPATLDEVAIIADTMPERLALFVVLASFVGLREGELLELRRGDIEPSTGQIAVSRKIDKDAIAGAPNPCPRCGRGISAPKTASGIRTVHLPPPLIPTLEHHLASHVGDQPESLLFPGERSDHMSVRYLMDRFKVARNAAGRPDLTIHHLRHTALTLAGQHGATAAELQARGGHASQAAMAIYQHSTLDRDRQLAARIGDTYAAWQRGRG
jgi:integrase